MLGNLDLHCRARDTQVTGHVGSVSMSPDIGRAVYLLFHPFHQHGQSRENFPALGSPQYLRYLGSNRLLGLHLGRGQATRGLHMAAVDRQPTG